MMNITEQKNSEQGCDCQEEHTFEVKDFDQKIDQQNLDIDFKYLPDVFSEEIYALNEKQKCNGYKTNGVALNSTTNSLWKDYCDLCQAIFTTPANLAYHYQQHTRKLKVWQIQEYNNKARALYAKLQVGSGSDAVFQCDRCSLNFKCPTELALHYGKHCTKSANLFHNDESIIKPKEMYKHLKFGTGKHTIYKCDRCKLECKDITKLAGHYHSHVGFHNIKQFRCNQCEITFSSRISLGKHYRKHTSGNEFLHECPECRKTFKTDQSLTSHIRLHTGDGKPYECPQCGKSYEFERRLTSHMRTHSIQRPYACKPCDKSFVNFSNWVTHTKTHGRERQLQCHYCGKIFSSPSALTYHINTHIGERPFKCAQCSQTFFNASHLSVHTRQHTGERPYKCEFCKKSFVQRKHLILHTRIHTGVKPYCCKICPDKAFIQNVQLKLHMKTHHGTQLK